MLQLNRKQMRQPIGGHHYVQNGVTFKADTFDKLVKDVEWFRIHNNIPIGHVDQEILKFYADHWPYMVEAANQQEYNDPEPAEEYYNHWREWVYKAWRFPHHKHVTEREAAERWIKCRNCPFNKEKYWPSTLESKELDRRAFILRRGVHVPNALGYCALHKVDISAFSFFENPKELSSKPIGEKDYEKCWV